MIIYVSRITRAIDSRNKNQVAAKKIKEKES